MGSRALRVGRRFDLSPSREQVRHFLGGFCRWAADQPDILAVALVGSYARNDATSDSDVDLIIVAFDPEIYLRDTSWAQRFGTISRQHLENYGNVTSLRVWYLGVMKSSTGFTDEAWCGFPLDEGTKKVVSGGMEVLGERGSMLTRLKWT